MLQEQREMKESMQRILNNQHDSIVKVCDDSLDSDDQAVTKPLYGAIGTDQSFGPDD